MAEVGGGARGVQGDVSNLADLDRLYDVVRQEAGRIDVLFANAGGGAFAALDGMTEAHFDRTFATNVKGTLFTVQKALPLLGDGASVILTGSTAADSPTSCVLDAQAARSGGVGVKGMRGYDPARRVVGRKRHVLIDTDGRLLVAAVSPANLHDSRGGVALLRTSRSLWPFLAHCFADRICRGNRVGSATAVMVEIVEPEDEQKGFAVQPRRWVRGKAETQTSPRRTPADGSVAAAPPFRPQSSPCWITQR